MGPAWRGWAIAAVACAANGCLSPPDGAGMATADAAADPDGDAAPSDAAPSDAATTCPTTVSFAFAAEEEVEDWGRIDAAGCDIAVDGTLSISHTGEVGTLCRVSRERLVDLRDSGLAVEMMPTSGDLHMSFLIVFDQPDVDFDRRRSVYVEHDEGTLRFGECFDRECVGHGSMVYDAGAHRWWQLAHSSTGQRVTLSVSSDGTSFTESDLGATLVATPEELACAGVILGSIESVEPESQKAEFDDLHTVQPVR